MKKTRIEFDIGSVVFSGIRLAGRRELMESIRAALTAQLAKDGSLTGVSGTATAASMARSLGRGIPAPVAEPGLERRRG